jgi:nucleoside-diphosphate-sugar epimerase
VNRVLVTGATGFIGTHALPLFADAGFEIHAASSRVMSDRAGPAIWHRCDLFDRACVEALAAKVRASHLLHLAWHTEPGKFWTSAENVRWVAASIDLLRAFERAGGRRVVMAGTCAEYDSAIADRLTESSPLEPATVYGQCKHALQVLLGSYSSATGISVAWGRIFNMYGPHEQPRRLVPDVISALSAGRRVPCTAGHQIRDFLHVEDVARAFVALLESNEQGAFNIASGIGRSLREVVSAIAHETGDAHLVDFGALPTPTHEPPRTVGDPARLMRLGWTPRYTLVDGIRETISWWGREARETEP